MSDVTLLLPELMAPAGDWDCARAAVENGADAVYFGLQTGLNARARAVNFSEAELPELMAYLHTRGVKGYLTLNTLVFHDELAEGRASGSRGRRRGRRRRVGARPWAAQAPRPALRGVAAACLDPNDLKQRRVHRRGRLARRAARRAAARAFDRADCRRATPNLHRDRGVRPRRAVHQLLGPMSGQPVVGRPQRQPGPMRPAVSAAPIRPSSKTRPTAKVSCCLVPHDLAAHDRVSALVAAGVSALKIEGRLKPGRIRRQHDAPLSHGD